MGEQIRAKIYWYLNFPFWKSGILFFGILGFFWVYKKYFRKESCGYIWVLWSVYLTAIISITFLGRSLGMAENSIDKIFLTYKLLLQGEIGALYEIVFNILLFVPLGLLCCSVKDSFSKSFILGAFFSLIIEGGQLFTGKGLFEICDLINNVVGAMIGYFLYTIFCRIIKKLND